MAVPDDVAVFLIGGCDMRPYMLMSETKIISEMRIVSVMIELLIWPKTHMSNRDDHFDSRRREASVIDRPKTSIRTRHKQMVTEFRDTAHNVDRRKLQQEAAQAPRLLRIRLGPSSRCS